MKAKVTVRLKGGVLDPQGKAVLHAAQSLGVEGIREVRVGKIFDIEFSGDSREKIQKELERLADKLLANTVIETFQVEIG